MPIPEAPIASPLTDVVVDDVMCPGVVTCLPDAPLATIAAIMATHGIHAVVLSQPERSTPLIVTDLELVRAALEGAGDAEAADIAHEPAVTVSTDATLDDAVAMMSVNSVAHLLATDPGSGTPAGIVSSFDVAAVVGGWEPRLARILRPDPATLPCARTLREARIGAVIHRGIATCPPDTPLATVAWIMAQHRVHCVAVVELGSAIAHAGRLRWGLLEDFDLVVALHREPLAAPATPIAARIPVALQESASLLRAAELMIEHDTRHVVAVGRSDLPTGIVSTLDVAWILAWSRRASRQPTSTSPRSSA